MNGGFLVAWGFGALLGLWWALAPNAAIRFYRSFGNRTVESLGPGMVRALGIVILAVVAMVVVVLAASRMA